MKVLILGGCGYIGSALFRYLKDEHEATTVDLEWFGNFINPDNINLDFKHLTRNYLDRFGAVILVAAHSSVQMCHENMRSTFKNNVDNFVNLLSKLNGSQRFIYASSSSLYAGLSGSAKEDEDRYTPENYYDLSKKEIDLYAQLSDVDYYSLRFGTVNGPSPNLRTDVMINKMYETAKGEGAITIYNPQVRRPLLGIKDLCRAIEAILAGPRKPGIYNIASFNETVGNIARITAAAAGVPVIDKGTSPTYDFHIDTTKFQDAFSFKFQETIESICSQLIQEYDNCNKTLRNVAKHYE